MKRFNKACLTLAVLSFLLVGCQPNEVNTETKLAPAANQQASSTTTKPAETMTPEEAYKILPEKIETAESQGKLPLFWKLYKDKSGIPTTPQGCKDGIYTAESPANNMGYKYVIELEIKDQKIVTIKYDEVDSKGLGKRADLAYQKDMKKDLNEVYSTYENALLEKQDLDQIDSISGATFSLYRFNIVASQAMYEARK